MPERREYSDAHLKILRAFERRWGEKGGPVDAAVVAGKNPFRRGKMFSYLNGLGIETRYLGEIRDPDLLILGRSWVEESEETKTKQLLKRRRGEKLRICSQEMLLAWAMTGVDPNKRPQTAETFVEGHPALQLVKEQLDGQWPKTERLPKPNHGDGEAGPFEEDESPLKRLGYEVGHSGKRKKERRRLLRKAYELGLEELPGSYSTGYLEEWGPAESGVRLKRIADHLAANCMSFRGRKKDYNVAIGHWEEDLTWLKQEFYNPLTYGFRWPETTG